MLCEISEIRSKQLSELLQVKQQVILCQTPDTLSGVCETLKLYKPYGVTFSKIGFWDGPPAGLCRVEREFLSKSSHFLKAVVGEACFRALLV